MTFLTLHMQCGDAYVHQHDSGSTSAGTSSQMLQYTINFNSLWGEQCMLIQSGLLRRASHKQIVCIYYKYTNNYNRTGHQKHFT